VVTLRVYDEASHNTSVHTVLINGPQSPGGAPAGRGAGP